MVNTDFYTVVMNQSNEGIFRILKQRSDNGLNTLGPNRDLVVDIEDRSYIDFRSFD